MKQFSYPRHCYGFALVFFVCMLGSFLLVVPLDFVIRGADRMCFSIVFAADLQLEGGMNEMESQCEVRLGVGGEHSIEKRGGMQPRHKSISAVVLSLWDCVQKSNNRAGTSCQKATTRSCIVNKSITDLPVTSVPRHV